jgi:hypothetical protein
VTDAPKHETVAAALAAVMGELGGVAKLTPEQRRRKGMAGGDERGVTYAYRGIDQIAAAAQPLFAKHGLVTVPQVVDHSIKEIVVNQKPWTDTVVTVDWTIAGPGDPLQARTMGWGRDNSDKGINKAMTGAFKNLLLRLLCIGDPDDDTDGHTHEADAKAAEPTYSKAALDLLAELRNYRDTPVAEAIKAFAASKGKGVTLAELEDEGWRQEITNAIDEAKQAAAGGV